MSETFDAITAAQQALEAAKAQAQARLTEVVEELNALTRLLGRIPYESVSESLLARKRAPRKPRDPGSLPGTLKRRGRKPRSPKVQPSGISG